MANVLIEESSLEDIADEIRAKNGSSATYRAADMAGAIRSLGGNVNDVQIDGTSIVTNNVANIPIASKTDIGVVDTNTQQFLGIKTFNGGVLKIGNYSNYTTDNYSELDFTDVTFTSSPSTSSGSRVAYILNKRAVNSSLNNNLSFNIRSPLANGTGYANGFETYKFPAIDTDLATYPEYTIITTKNISDIPDASATEAGKVSTDTQHFGGMKYFDYGTIALDSVARSPAVNYRQISFKDGNIQSGGNTVQNAVIISQTSAVGVTTNNKLGFRLKSPTTDGTAYTSYYDTYSLPTATAGLTANADYDIITTKPTYEFTGTWSSSYTNCPCFSAMTVGSQVEIEWKQYGKLVCANFKVMRGADTSAGSNCYGANIRTDYLPAVTVCSAGYYSSSAIIAKYDTNGTFTCRVIGATLALNNVVQIGMTFMLA